MPAGNVDLYIEAGSEYSKSFIRYQPRASIDAPKVPYNFTGITGKAQIKRKTPLSTTGYNMVVEILNPTTGVFTVKLPHSTSSLIPCGDTIFDNKSKYVWALEFVGVSGKPERFLEGNVLISAEVVR